MDLEVLLKPNASEDIVKELVRRLYGLEVMHIKRMVSFDDQNFHIQVSKEYQNPSISQIVSDGYNLKVTNVNRSSDPHHFDSMHAAMIHVREKGLPVPVPVKTLSGRTWMLEKVPLLNEENLAGDKLCGIHLLEYIPGIPISKVPYTSDILYQWGVLLAKFQNALTDFHYPALEQKQFLWNLDNVPGLRQYMVGLDSEKEKLVNGVLDKYSEEIAKNMKKLPKGIIHGDFNENNVLVQSDQEGGPYEVVGILDFEDLSMGTYVWDLGVTLAYTMLDCHDMDPLVGAGHALAGYLSLRSLSSLELSLVKICIESRLCQSLVLCLHSYKLDPKNSYLLSSSKTGWTRLEQIFNTKNEELLQKWKKIQMEHECKKLE